MLREEIVYQILSDTFQLVFILFNTNGKKAVKNLKIIQIKRYTRRILIS